MYDFSNSTPFTEEIVKNSDSATVANGSVFLRCMYTLFTEVIRAKNTLTELAKYIELAVSTMITIVYFSGRSADFGNRFDTLFACSTTIAKEAMN